MKVFRNFMNENTPGYQPKMNKKDLCFGVDFDNTIVSYADIMYQTALKWRVIAPGTEKEKKIIRDQIRGLPDGEIKWRKIQAFVYGKAMGQAQLMDGVRSFFMACKEMGIPLFIVSHKTQYAGMDEDNIDLRETAMTWMRENQFFDEDGLGLAPESIFFESTRQEKIRRIRQLKCSHFIDDLEETFLESSFPAGVEKILFTSRGNSSDIKDLRILGRWSDIRDYLLNAPDPAVPGGDNLLNAVS